MLPQTSCHFGMGSREERTSARHSSSYAQPSGHRLFCPKNKHGSIAPILSKTKMFENR